MEYHKEVTLKDGRECILRNGTEDDAREVLDIFKLTHAETDYLLTYPDESGFTAEQESAFLRAKTESDNEIEIVAVIDGRIAGTAGIDAVGNKYKTKHRAEFGISIASHLFALSVVFRVGHIHLYGVCYVVIFFHCLISFQQFLVLRCGCVGFLLVLVPRAVSPCC